MSSFANQLPHDTVHTSMAGAADGASDKAAVKTITVAGEKVQISTAGRKAKPRPENSVVQVKCSGLQHDITVPYAQLKLSNGDKILRYAVDLEPDTLQRQPVRSAWHQGEAHKTQLEYAREGIITPEMEYIALRESACFAESIVGDTTYLDKSVATHARFVEGPAGAAGTVEFDLDKLPVTPEFVRAEVAAGRAVIPCNRKHPESEPMIIGRKFLTKVNANIGASAVSSGHEEEIAKLKLSLRFGADTVMDLSTGLPDLGSLRQAIIRSSPVPIGTVPIYETLDRVKGEAAALNWDVFKQVIIDQCEQGVDYFTIHAGLTKELLPLAAKRLMGIVSRGGAIMASHMLTHDCENMAYEHFDELMEICKRYDVALSLGDGLRPGAIYDACDEAQYGELKHLGELAARCFEYGVQCFIEGPGHVPLHKVAENQRLEDEYCHEAPFYTLGPLVTDAGAGFDHITSAIGGTTIGMHGTAMLCYVTPSEHLALPTPEDVKQGLITYKIAAHSADLAKGLKQAYNLDHAMSRARATFRWYDQFALSFDPQHAYEVWKQPLDDEECTHEVAYCSMCGPRFCPIRLNRRLQSKFK